MMMLSMSKLEIHQGLQRQPMQAQMQEHTMKVIVKAMKEVQG
jgi:hypothetical protein